MTNLDQWLERLGLAQYRQAFADNDIDLEVIADLSEQDLASLGVSLGHRKRLMRAIEQLDAGRTGRAARHQPRFSGRLYHDDSPLRRLCRPLHG